MGIPPPCKSTIHDNAASESRGNFPIPEKLTKELACEKDPPVPSGRAAWADRSLEGPANRWASSLSCLSWWGMLSYPAIFLTPFCICQCRTSSHSFIKRKNLAISAPSRSWIIARLAFHSMQQERRFGGSAAPAGFSFPDLPRMGAGRRGAGRTPPDRRTPRPRKATASWRCCRQGR